MHVNLKLVKYCKILEMLRISIRKVIKKSDIRIMSNFSTILKRKATQQIFKPKHKKPPNKLTSKNRLLQIYVKKN